MLKALEQCHALAGVLVLQPDRLSATQKYLRDVVEHDIFLPVTRKAFRRSVNTKKSVEQAAAGWDRSAEESKLLGTLHVLFAEDNIVNERVMCRLLEFMGIEYKAVRDGAEAVAEFCRHEVNPYNLILTDIEVRSALFVLVGGVWS